MKKTIITASICLIICTGAFSDVEEHIITVGPKTFVGASVIAGFNVPMVSYGLGAKLHYKRSEEYLNSYFVELEWNRRGGIKRGVTTALDYIDLNFGPCFGRRFFFKSGLAVGVLAHASELAKELADNPFNRFDFGGVLSVGGFFNEEKPRSLFVFELKVSMVNAFPPEWPRQVATNITWGGAYSLLF